VSDGDGSDDIQADTMAVLVMRQARVESLEGSEDAVDLDRRDYRLGAIENTAWPSLVWGVITAAISVGRRSLV
jgi:hypothetical protein